MRLALAAALTFGALAGCGEAQGADPSPHPQVTADDSTVRLVDRTEADFLLFVSNQSFDDEEVTLAVTVDGVTVVDASFHVEGQHNWISFPLDLPSGEHEITAAADSGATLRRTFATPPGKKRYAVIDHWTDDGPAYLTWQFQRQAPAFS